MATHSLNPLIRLCRDSFVRNFQGVGYISNQRTKDDRIYDEVGGVFLQTLSRFPQTLDDAVRPLIEKFRGVAFEEMRSDYLQFVAELESSGFVVTGSSLAELDNNDLRFTYGAEWVSIKEQGHSILNPDGKQPTDSETFLAERFSDSPLLLNLQIELTSNCNESCKHCYLPRERERLMNNSVVVQRVIAEYAQMGGLLLVLSGGEPMLHPDLTAFLKLAREHDLCIALLSNATLLTRSIIEVLAEVGMSQVQVSIYSLDPAEHDEITRVPGSLAKTLASIDALIEANIPLQISCPVMNTNYRSYPSVLKWAKSLGLKALTDFIMIARTDFTMDNVSERLDEAKIREFLANLAQEDATSRSTFGQEANRHAKGLRSPEKRVCEVGRERLCLAANGKYYPCSGWQGMCVGDANTTSLQDVWKHSSQLAQLRRVVWGSFPKCITCADSHSCKMCLVRNFNESGGDMFKINEHFCRVARINREVTEQHSASNK